MSLIQTRPVNTATAFESVAASRRSVPRQGRVSLPTLPSPQSFSFELGAAHCRSAWSLVSARRLSSRVKNANIENT